MGLPLEQPQRLRVVVADDSDSIRVLLRTLISVEADLDLVGEARDGAEAVEVAEREQPDLLLLDLAMPRMDGLQVLERLTGTCPRTRIVVFTGYSAHKLKAASSKLGAVDYVEKGIEPGPLLERLRRAAGA